MMHLLLGLWLALAVAWAGRAPPPAEPVVPAGFVPMTVVGLVPTDPGPVVLLTDATGQTVVPVWIGEAEAITIALRLNRRRLERPLTHDLLATVLEQTGAKVSGVRIDGLIDGTFVATAWFVQGDKRFKVDVRSSDAIALALGHDLPLLVADSVVTGAGVSREDLEKQAPQTPPEEGGGTEDKGGVSL